MKSADIQEAVYQWAINSNFDAPYGVLTGEHTNTKGRKYLSVTFGRARTLDATVEIYNKSFILVNTSRTGRVIFRSVESMLNFIERL